METTEDGKSKDCLLKSKAMKSARYTYKMTGIEVHVEEEKEIVERMFLYLVESRDLVT